MLPNETKKPGQKDLSEIKEDAKRAIEELGADELAAVENVAAGAQDVVICNSHCG